MGNLWGGISHELLEERIVKDGIVKPGNVLKVDSFLNHQMDIVLIEEIGREFKRRYAGKTIDKVLTIEASGIRFRGKGIRRAHGFCQEVEVRQYRWRCVCRGS